MTLTWTKENSPRWDVGKQRIFGPAELAAVGLAAPPAPGEPVANEWWRVSDGGEVAGYGWLDTEWGDARITFIVAPGRRGRGVGAFILEHLEDEAAARGLNYIYNVIPDTHPDGPWIRNWLSTHGFHESSRGQLRRQVVTRVLRPAPRQAATQDDASGRGPERPGCPPTSPAPLSPYRGPNARSMATGNDNAATAMLPEQQRCHIDAANPVPPGACDGLYVR